MSNKMSNYLNQPCQPKVKIIKERVKINVKKVSTVFKLTMKENN